MKISGPPEFTLLQQEYMQHLTERMTQIAKLLNSSPNNPDIDIPDFLTEIKDYSEFSVTDENGALPALGQIPPDSHGRYADEMARR